MFKRFLVFFVSLCSFMMGIDLEKYRLYVKDVDTEFHAIALTNGLVCNVIEKDLGKEKSLEIGEEVKLMFLLRDIEQKESKQDVGEFLLAFLRDGEQQAVRIWVTEESKLNVLSFVSSSTVVQQAGWFSSEVTQKIVELSDGSKWEVGKSREVEFSKGDHVVFLFLTTNGKWYLTNLDQSFPPKVKNKSRDHLRGLNFIMDVKPYDEGFLSIFN
jgi:hypothetical protein